jgi:DNA segregation ATPase FtsK/SpoIIIE, S-DNA-T family
VRAEIVLQAPPILPRPSSGAQAAMQMFMYLPMMLGMGAMSLFYVASAGGVMLVVWGVMFGVSTGGMILMGMGRGGMARKGQINDERRDYLRYLDQTRSTVRELTHDQQNSAMMQHPDPGGLQAVIDSVRLWERRPGDPDFLQARIGVGPQKLACALKVPQTAPLEDLDPLCATSLRQFVRTYSVVPNLPVALSLTAFPRVALHGDRDVVTDVVRALLLQLATFHRPEDVRIAVCTSLAALPEWEWLKWVPHAAHRSEVDGAGPLRLAAPDLAVLERILGDEVANRPRYSRAQPSVPGVPHLVVVVDGGAREQLCRLADETGLSGVTILDLAGERAGVGPYGLRLVVEPQRMGSLSSDHVNLAGRPDRLGPSTAETLARSLARMHVPGRRDAEPAAGAPLTGNLSLTDLLGVGDVRSFDVDRAWRPRLGHSRLRIPIGVDSAGEPVEIDFKESAEEGMGPHGLLIGATGSGKSELLRTIVLGLAITHPSETLNFVLVDFKGGATFAGLHRLQHTAAVITNLADDSTMVERMADALKGEIVRRQELLRDAGNYASMRDYERARVAGAPLAPLPTLMVIIDEFSELLAQQPDFIDVFVMIGRLGRSLGVHLMLASQRLEEGRLRGLDSHLSYRIGLRTFSASESRTVLGVTDAAELPSVPGSGFLRIDASTLIRFKAAYVSGPAPVPRSRPADPAERESPLSRGVAAIRPFSLAPVPVQPPPVIERVPAEQEDDESEASPFDETVYGVVLSRLEGQGVPAHQVWLPPLDVPPTLDQLLPMLGVTQERGLHPVGWPGVGRLRAPVGIIDKPFEQRQDLMWVDLSGGLGHVVVVGAPRSGKSTLLRTVITSLSLTHTPREVQFYCLDFGGGTLTGLAGLPHVGGVANRLDEERCSRIVAEVRTALEERERIFDALGIDSIDTFRARRAAGERFGQRDFGDVFLVVDGWLTLKEDFERLHDQVSALVARGLAYGVHVVLAANRWMEIRAQVKDLLGTRLELRLGDPMDAEVARRAAALVPENVPGRGMTKEKLHFLAALPRADGRSAVDSLAEGVRWTAERLAGAWPGEQAPAVRLLPRLVTGDELDAAVRRDQRRAAAGRGLRVPFGLAERDLEPVYLDLDAEPHLVIFGDAGTGKTGLLRGIGRALARTYDRDRVRLLPVDYRRGLLGQLSEPHLTGFGGAAAATNELIGRVLYSFQERMPGPEVTPAQLRDCSWWSGPELVLLVDDYDLVATGRENPLASLLEILPHSRDIGLHVVVTRRSAGAGRGAYDPFLQRLGEVGAAGLLLSGSKEEGAVFAGQKMFPLPPGRGLLVRRSDGANLVQLAWPGEAV